MKVVLDLRYSHGQASATSRRVGVMMEIQERFPGGEWRRVDLEGFAPALNPFDAVVGQADLYALAHMDRDVRIVSDSGDQLWLTLGLPPTEHFRFELRDPPPESGVFVRT